MLEDLFRICCFVDGQIIEQQMLGNARIIWVRLISSVKMFGCLCDRALILQENREVILRFDRSGASLDNRLKFVYRSVGLIEPDQTKSKVVVSRECRSVHAERTLKILRGLAILFQ